MTLQWRHNERDGISNHRRLHYLFNFSFRCRSKKISNLRVTGVYAGNLPVTGKFHPQKASNTENVSIWWRHHEFYNIPSFITIATSIAIGIAITIVIVAFTFSFIFKSASLDKQDIHPTIRCQRWELLALLVLPCHKSGLWQPRLDRNKTCLLQRVQFISHSKGAVVRNYQQIQISLTWHVSQPFAVFNNSIVGYFDNE